MLINVVVAVLLEKCLDSGGDDLPEEVQEGDETEGVSAMSTTKVASKGSGQAASAAEGAQMREELTMVMKVLKELQVDVAQLKDSENDNDMKI